MTSHKTLAFLKICFFLNVLAFVNVFIFIATAPLNVEPQISVDSTLYNVLGSIGAVFSFGAMVLWGYCIYFFYKYDKYSRGILKIIFFPGLFSMFYFYNVIWKRKRPLENTINDSESVLGKTIHLVDEDNSIQ